MSADYASLVEYIVKNIVENPDAVEVDGSSRRHRAQTVEVRLDPSDVGRVIGKGGKNIEAIRAVVKAAAIKDHQRVNVEVITDDEVYGDAGDQAPEAEAQGAGDDAASSHPDHAVATSGPAEG
jgi:predicted RNA-binding protein YlqC (UPF0109 family)